METIEKFEILVKFLKEADKLTIEALSTLIDIIREQPDIDLEEACNHALMEWDI